MNNKIKDFLLYISEVNVTIIISEKEEIDFENVSFHVVDGCLVIDNSSLIENGAYESPRSLTFLAISEDNLKQIRAIDSINLGVVTDDSEIKYAFNLPNKECK